MKTLLAVTLLLGCAVGQMTTSTTATNVVRLESQRFRLTPDEARAWHIAGPPCKEDSFQCPVIFLPSTGSAHTILLPAEQQTSPATSGEPIKSETLPTCYQIERGKLTVFMPGGGYMTFTRMDREYKRPDEDYPEWKDVPVCEWPTSADIELGTRQETTMQDGLPLKWNFNRLPVPAVCGEEGPCKPVYGPPCTPDSFQCLDTTIHTTRYVPAPVAEPTAPGLPTSADLDQWLAEWVNTHCRLELQRDSEGWADLTNLRIKCSASPKPVQK